jgi:hypothetical protein
MPLSEDSMFQCSHGLSQGATAVFLLALGLAACGGGGGGGGVGMPDPPPPPPPPPPWFTPDCATVAGAPIASYSDDVGITIVPNAESVEVNQADRTTGIAFAYGYGGLLFAAHAATRSVYISNDAGCSWTLAATAPPGRNFTAIVGGRQWGFAVHSDTSGNASTVVRVNPDSSVNSFELPFRVWGLATTPADSEAVYGLLSSYEIVRSGDQGETWITQGTKPATPGLPRALAINPADALHIIVAGQDGEVAVSFDGGNSWAPSTGILRGAQSGGALAPTFGSDGITTDVWVFGARTFRDGDQIVSTERFIARSIDGGLSFEDVVMQGGDVFLANAVSLATRPRIAGELMFTGIDCPFQPARLYHYRAADDTVTVITYQDHPEVRGFGSIVFHPADPDVLYVGHQAEGECPR